MRIVDTKNFAAGLLFIAFGAATAIMASRYPIGTAARMGPGFFPLGVGLALVVTGLIVSLSALGSAGTSKTFAAWPLKNAAIVLAAVVLFALLIQPAGLIVAVPVLVGFSALAHPQFSWRETLLSIVVLLILTWAIFVVFLGLQFPLLPPALTQ